jgi:hypothetical protein
MVPSSSAAACARAGRIAAGVTEAEPFTAWSEPGCASSGADRRGVRLPGYRPARTASSPCFSTSRSWCRRPRSGRTRARRTRLRHVEVQRSAEPAYTYRRCHPARVARRQSAWRGSPARARGRRQRVDRETARPDGCRAAGAARHDSLGRQKRARARSGWNAADPLHAAAEVIRAVWRLSSSRFWHVEHFAKRSMISSAPARGDAAPCSRPGPERRSSHLLSRPPRVTNSIIALCSSVRSSCASGDDDDAG